MVKSKKMLGTLLPMSSVVSNKFGSGNFKAGTQFVDWLVKTGQTAWQMLPLNQTQLEKGSAIVHVPSPYKGYGIGLDPRYLWPKETKLSDEELRQFRVKHQDWLDDYSLFCALRDHFGSDDWRTWPKEIATFSSEKASIWRIKLKAEIEGHEREQCLVHKQYGDLREKAKRVGISLIGDLPFYVGVCSPLVWRYRELFEMNEAGKTLKVSGVLAGVKSHYGRQVWGHPLYRWGEKKLHQDILALFKLRIAHLASLYDYARMDHAKGLFSYGVIDPNDAKGDKYVSGPGSDLFDQLVQYAKKLGLSLYAEDTGDKLKSLRQCLTKHKMPGVKIFRFAYNERRKIFSLQYLLIDRYPRNTVAYTTTHDTETLKGYLEKLSSAERESLQEKLKLAGIKDINTLAVAIREKIVYSPANFVIIPLQDWILSTQRINTPGTEREHADPNWRYRMEMAVEDLPVESFI